MSQRRVSCSIVVLLGLSLGGPALAAPVQDRNQVDARPEGFPWAPGVPRPAPTLGPSLHPTKLPAHPVRPSARPAARPAANTVRPVRPPARPAVKPHRPAMPPAKLPPKPRPLVPPQAAAVSHVPVMDRHITVSVSGLPLQDAIRLVASKGPLNIAIEDDLRQPVNVEFRDVRLADALDTLFAMGGVQAVWRGNIFAVVGRKKAFERGLLSSNARVFVLKYASASRIADFLNTTALIEPYQGTMHQSNTNQQERLELAHADPRTNSVLVMGTPADIELAERTIAALDKPIAQRIFKLDHADAVNVAALLNATLFNNGNKSPVTSEIRADVPSISEGSGHSAPGAGVQLDAGTGTIRSRIETTTAIPIEAKQSIAVPDSRTNSVIVIGSPELIQLAAQMIPKLDRKLPQVSIEVEVIEVNTQDALDLGTTLSAASGAVSTTLDVNASNPNPGWSLAVDPANPSSGSFKVRLDALVKNHHARLLAHPTVLASDNSEAQINIVDEVVKGTRISNQGVSTNGQSLLVVEPIFGSAGVTLNILPQIGADGMVTLRLHPTVSSVRETQRDSSNNLIALLSRRELLAQQVVVPSGRSLLLGGLTQTNRISGASKLPILGDIPVIGALFGSLSNQNNGTELMITVTPRILKD